MRDICDLILDDHESLRRGFAELDQSRGHPPERLRRLWEPLAALLEVHAAAEEEVFYPALLDNGRRAKDETLDAIKDHNEIRDAVAAARSAEVAGDAWWTAVGDARKANSDHMAEEEQGALADLRANTPESLRGALGEEFAAYETDHRGERDLDETDKDPEEYVRRHDAETPAP